MIENILVREEQQHAGILKASSHHQRINSVLNVKEDSHLTKSFENNAESYEKELVLGQMLG